MITINYLAVLVAGIVGMTFGFIWYGPLFGKTWIKLMGFSQAEMDKAKEKGMAKTYFWAFMMVLLMAYVLAHFVSIVDAITAGNAFQLAFWIWLGFIVTIQASAVLWTGRPVKLFLIDIFHYLVTIYVMALILTFWK